MHFWIAIVVIIAIIAFSKTRHGRPVLMARPAGEQPEPADRSVLVNEIAALNGRIAVLERIITDNRGSQGLAREIDALRDR